MNTDQKAALDDRLQKQIDYAIDLQRIIEGICNDRDIAKPETTARHHYDMAISYQIKIRSALQAAQVEKVEGLAEALREFDDLPEQDTTSLIILKAARLQLARQEGK